MSARGEILIVAFPDLRTGCSHCEWRYDRLAPEHPAHWLLQWHPREHYTIAWTACSATLEHALHTITAGWDTFLVSDAPSSAEERARKRAWILTAATNHAMAARYEMPQIIETRTLGDALPAELARVRDHVMPSLFPVEGEYESVVLGALRRDMDAAAHAMIAGDVVAMLEVFARLQRYESPPA